MCNPSEDCRGDVFVVALIGDTRPNPNPSLGMCPISLLSGKARCETCLPMITDRSRSTVGGTGVLVRGRAASRLSASGPQLLGLSAWSSLRGVAEVRMHRKRADGNAGGDTHGTSQVGEVTERMLAGATPQVVNGKLQRWDSRGSP
jgi:hypothetical protein